MQPSEAEFKEWQQHPVTEWVFALVGKFSDAQKEHWAELAWISEKSDQEGLMIAKVRADCYAALSSSSFDDWKAIDDTKS
jgi:hypothetical protein